MSVEIVPVRVGDKAELWTRMQAYMAELMQFGNFAPVDGVFQYPWFDLYWKEPGRHPFWALADENRAAFALVHCEGHAGKWTILCCRIAANCLDRRTTCSHGEQSIFVLDKQ